MTQTTAPRYAAEFFEQCASLSDNHLLIAAQKVSRNRDLASMLALTECLERIGKGSPSFMSNDTLTVDVQLGDKPKHNHLWGEHRFSSCFVGVLRPLDGKQHADDDVNAYLDRVISLYARTPETIPHIETMVHHAAHSISNASVHRKLLDAVPGDLFTVRKDDTDRPSSAFESAVVNNTLDVATIVLGRTDPNLVRHALIAGIQSRYDTTLQQAFKDDLSNDTILRAVGQQLIDDPLGTCRWVDAIDQKLGRIGEPDPSEWEPQHLAATFRMMAATSYLAHTLARGVEWNEETVNLLMPTEVTDPTESPVHKLLKDFLVNQESEDSWMCSHAHHDAVRDHIKPELHFVNAVLATHCTPLLPLCKDVLQAGIAHDGPGLTATIPGTDLQSQFHASDLPSFNPRRFDTTMRFMLDEVHGSNTAEGLIDRNANAAVLRRCATTDVTSMSRTLPVLLSMGANLQAAFGPAGFPEDVSPIEHDHEDRWLTIVRSFQAKQQANELIAGLTHAVSKASP